MLAQAADDFKWWPDNLSLPLTHSLMLRASAWEGMQSCVYEFSVCNEWDWKIRGRNLKKKTGDKKEWRDSKKCICSVIHSHQSGSFKIWADSDVVSSAFDWRREAKRPRNCAHLNSSCLRSGKHPHATHHKGRVTAVLLAKFLCNYLKQQDLISRKTLR